MVSKITHFIGPMFLSEDQANFLYFHQFLGHLQRTNRKENNQNIMGRKFPLAHNHLPISVEPALSLSFLLAGMVTAITISTILCSVRFRKKSDPDPSKSRSSDRTVENCDPSTETLQPVETAGLQASSDQSVDRKENDSEESQAKDLPLPPARQLGGEYSCKKVMTNSTSMRNLTKDVSVKIQRSMSMAMKRDKEDKLMNHKTKLGKPKNDDSVWMKTIILGEKCKVPDEEEAIIYESKGKKVQAFHPRTPSTISLSRQNSSIDFTAIPPSDRDKGILVRKEEEAFS